MQSSTHASAGGQSGGDIGLGDLHQIGDAIVECADVFAWEGGERWVVEVYSETRGLTIGQADERR